MTTPSRPAILHCHSTFSLGGKEARAVRLMNIFGDRVRHTLLSAMPDQMGARKAIMPEISVDFPDETRAPTLYGKPNPARYLALGRYFQNFDLILSYNWGSMDAVMAHRLLSHVMPLPPLIHHEDGFNADESDRLNWKRNSFRRIALPTARHIVVPSHRLEALVRREWGGGLPVTRISNGIVVADYAVPPEPGAIPGFSRNADDVVVGTIAGLRAVKDLPLLVEALALTPSHVRLVIVGEGPERDVIAARAKALGIADRVQMPGFLGRPAAFAGLFDIMALSSLSEQQPIAVMEGMAAALPIVAPPVGDVAAMVAASNTSFIVSRTPTDLAAAIMRLANDAALRRSIGEDNRCKAQSEFDEGGMVSRYARLYGEAVGRPHLFEGL
jgi:glycosyltransferase involved in cell wall biosynthesis